MAPGAITWRRAATWAVGTALLVAAWGAASLAMLGPVGPTVRVAAVKADSTFDSAAIDPYGRILARHVTKDGSRHTLVADVPVGGARTPFVTLGDWVGYAAIMGTLAFAALSVVSRTRRRARRSLSPRRGPGAA